MTTDAGVKSINRGRFGQRSHLPNNLKPVRTPRGKTMESAIDLRTS